MTAKQLPIAGTEMSDAEIAHRDLASKKCPACNRPKKEMESFCKADYFSLPPAIRKTLYATFAEGYTTNYMRALEYLEAAKAEKKAGRA